MDNAVFVVHGRNRAASKGIFDFLRAIGIRPIEWTQAIELTGKPAPFVGEILDAAFSHAIAVLVLFTPDEVAYLVTSLSDGHGDPDTIPAPQARPNVIFEAGMALGRNPDRTVLVEMGQCRSFSDLAGRHVVRLDNSIEARNSLVSRLKLAGCSVTLGGNWADAGDLTPPARPGGNLPLGKRVPSPLGDALPELDLTYYHNGANSRLDVINRGRQDVFDVNIDWPEVAGQLVLVGEELPIKRVPAGKQVRLRIARYLGDSNNFDVQLTGHLADGTAISQTVFLSCVD